MSGDYEWSDMPRDLALLLKAFSDDPSQENGGELGDWLANEMRHCAATKVLWPRLMDYCPDLPEVGSEFCKAHGPEEDVNGH